ncbi:hypothetical protein ZQ34_004005 [Salmonella enterica subsp. salamae]|nr:hypothetical protein [Salmonella enterica subsp. enterica serovar Everleigh]EDV1506064.1 hypothetical protein [Salmonella enterica subsp. salamae]EEI9684437.1 hypothetical protein [Salmonella enterica]ECD5051698.1 hypothetical protein [Salmonella enterica subsp. enterica serovar Everleigh]EED7441520.1 hypothetical protein [Salmonella enterica subsp. salamae]
MYVPISDVYANIVFNDTITPPYVQLSIPEKQWSDSYVVAVINTRCPVHQTYRATGAYVAIPKKVSLTPSIKVSLTPSINADISITPAGGSTITDTQGFLVSMTLTGMPASGERSCDSVGTTYQWRTILKNTEITMKIPSGILPGHYTGAITGAFASSIINTDTTPIHFTVEDFLRSATKNLTINYDINITNVCNPSDSTVNINHGMLSPLAVVNSTVKKEMNLVCTNFTPVSLQLIWLTPSSDSYEYSNFVSVGLGKNIESRLSIILNGVKYKEIKANLEKNTPLTFQVNSELKLVNGKINSGAFTGNAVLKIDYI